MTDGKVKYCCHAAAQAHERYGVMLGMADLSRLAHQCQERSGVFIGTRNSRETWLVKHQEVVLIAVYDRPTHRVVTFLPRQMRLQDRVKRSKPPGKKRFTLQGGNRASRAMRPVARFLRRRYQEDHDA